MSKKLADDYYQTKNPAYLGKKRTLELEIKKNKQNVTDNELTDFLLGQTAYNLFKSPKKKFPRRPIVIKAPFECCSSDLGDLQASLTHRCARKLHTQMHMQINHFYPFRFRL